MTSPAAGTPATKDANDQQKHFTQAVAELGERQDVVASKAIFNAQGQKVLDKGASINLKLYERLMQHHLVAPIEDSLTSSNTVNGESLRSAAESIIAELPFFGRLAQEDATRKLLLNVLETVPLPEAMAFQLTVARDVRPEVYMNLVRTALVAVWLARTPLVSRYDLGMAASAGLLHDIGMLHVDPVLLQPGQTLNREQRRQLYSHPLVSTTLVERHHQYPREVVRAVCEHQEYLDGSGYPRNLAGETISPLGRIVSLAQVVGAMFAPGRSAPEMHLSVLLRLNTDRYDTELAMRILGQLQPQLDVMSAAITLLDDPIGLLGETDAVLAQWPLPMPDGEPMTGARVEGMAMVAEHARKMRRALAGVGAVPDQLAQLGDDLDEALQTELTLLTREASWQLRTLTREARRRWRDQDEQGYPDTLRDWLEQADALVAKVAGPVAVAPASTASD